MSGTLIHVREDALSHTRAKVVVSPERTYGDSSYVYPASVVAHVDIGYDLTLTMPVEVATALRDALTTALDAHDHTLETSGRPA